MSRRLDRALDAVLGARIRTRPALGFRQFPNPGEPIYCVCGSERQVGTNRLGQFMERCLRCFAITTYPGPPMRTREAAELEAVSDSRGRSAGNYILPVHRKKRAPRESS